MNMMSSAFMSRVGLKFLLDCHFTPLRRKKVYSSPSLDTVHFSARPGTTLVPPRSKSTSVAVDLLLASNEVPVVLMLGVEILGLPSEQYTSVLAERVTVASSAAVPGAQRSALLVPAQTCARG
jgi:hypothetical protein